MPAPVKVGIIGCGDISDRYIENCKRFDILDVAGCADLIEDRAQVKADLHAVAKACSPQALLADPQIEIILNLTTPEAHAEIALAALEAGKHIYNEKPLTVAPEDGLKVLTIANEKGLLVGGAPDTFLGAALQTCRNLIDDGAIGKPVAATAFMLNHGHEHWHPNPAYYYQPGAGPLFDMGPYYLTALVTLLGPIREVAAFTATTFPERTITSQPQYGTKINVNTPTHIAGLMTFDNGAIGTIITSFDVWAHRLPHIEIHGTKGSLSVPDPNCFGGPVLLHRADDEAWVEVPHTHGYAENSRGIGVADMACALRLGRKHRANGELAYHVLDVMHALLASGQQTARIRLKSTCTPPAPLPMGLREWTLAL